MNRPSLHDLGVHLPPLAVTTAGSLPATIALRDARRAHARAGLSDGELAEETQRASAHWIAVQERLGLDVLVDGNLDGHDLVCGFTDGLAGFTPGGLVRIYGDRYRRKPIIAGPVSWREPIRVNAWRALQSLTSRPLKARVTGPYTLMRWSFDVQYATRDAACLAIAAALRQELNALVAAGARVIQLDEPALAVSGADWGLAGEALRLVTTGVGAYVIAHTGHGIEGPTIDQRCTLPVDNIDLLGLPAFEDLAGLPDGIHATVEVGPDVAPAALQAAIATYGTERLWLTSPWDLGYMTPDRAEAQLEAIAGAAATARGAPSSATPPAPDAVTIDLFAAVPAPQADEPPAPQADEPPVTPTDEASATPIPAALDLAGDPVAPLGAELEPEQADEPASDAAPTPPSPTDRDPTREQ